MSAQREWDYNSELEDSTGKVIPFPIAGDASKRQESTLSVATATGWVNVPFLSSSMASSTVVIAKSKSELEQKFNRLASEWRRDISGVSSSGEIFFHPSYQHIIGMGEFVIPFILREFQQELEHWDYALWCITGENPVKPEYAGRMDKIAEAWIRWGKQHRYI